MIGQWQRKEQTNANGLMPSNRVRYPRTRRGDSMKQTLTVVHYPGDGAGVHCNGDRVPYSQFIYAIGDKPPRYPVPAIEQAVFDVFDNVPFISIVRYWHYSGGICMIEINLLAESED